MRILFHGPSTATHRFNRPIPFVSGLPARTGTTLAEMRPGFNLTGNRGNIVHAEAVFHLFNYTATASAIGDVHRLFDSCGSIQDFQALIKDNFDAVVFSLANYIRPSFNTRLDEIVDVLPVPFYIFGSGLQNPTSMQSLRPSTRKLIAIASSESDAARTNTGAMIQSRS